MQKLIESTFLWYLIYSVNNKLTNTILPIGSQTISPFKVVPDYICDCNFKDEGFWVHNSVQSTLARVLGNSDMNWTGVFLMTLSRWGQIIRYWSHTIYIILSIHALNTSLTDLIVWKCKNVLQGLLHQSCVSFASVLSKAVMLDLSFWYISFLWICWQVNNSNNVTNVGYFMLV